MDALQQVVERQLALTRYYQFPIQHELLRLNLANPLDHLWKIAGQGLAGLRLKLDRVPIAEYKTAKSIPFGSYSQSAPDGISVALFASMGRKGRASGRLIQTCRA